MGSAATGLLLQVQGTRRDRDRRLKSSQSQMGAGLADPTATPLMQHRQFSKCTKDNSKSAHFSNFLKQI